MQTDNSYTPLRTDFDAVVKSHFNGQPVTEDMHKLMKAVFFAGAASAYSLLSKTPDQAVIMFEELSDYVGQTAAAVN